MIVKVRINAIIITTGIIINISSSLSLTLKETEYSQTPSVSLCALDQSWDELPWCELVILGILK